MVVDSRFKAKHSLDSDEEDEVKESSVMDEEEIEGQEDSTVVGGWVWGDTAVVCTYKGRRRTNCSLLYPTLFQTYEEGICITPFNLKSEMEEGYFDSDGNYFEKQDPDKVEDTWLEGVDWDKVSRPDLTFGRDYRVYSLPILHIFPPHTTHTTHTTHTHTHTHTRTHTHTHHTPQTHTHTPHTHIHTPHTTHTHHDLLHLWLAGRGDAKSVQREGPTRGRRGGRGGG